MLEGGCLFFHHSINQCDSYSSSTAACQAGIRYRHYLCVSCPAHTIADGVVCLKMLNTDKAFTLYCPSILLFDELRCSQKHIASDLFAGHARCFIA